MTGRIPADDHVAIEGILRVVAAPAAFQPDLTELGHQPRQHRKDRIFKVICEKTGIDIIDEPGRDIKTRPAAGKSVTFRAKEHAAFILDQRQRLKVMRTFPEMLHPAHRHNRQVSAGHRRNLTHPWASGVDKEISRDPLAVIKMDSLNPAVTAGNIRHPRLDILNPEMFSRAPKAPQPRAGINPSIIRGMTAQHNILPFY